MLQVLSAEGVVRGSSPPCQDFPIGLFSGPDRASAGSVLWNALGSGRSAIGHVVDEAVLLSNLVRSGDTASLPSCSACRCGEVAEVTHTVLAGALGLDGAAVMFDRSAFGCVEVFERCAVGCVRACSGRG